MPQTKKKTTTKKAAPSKPVAEKKVTPAPPKPPVADSEKPISLFRVGDNVKIGNDVYVINFKQSTVVGAIKQRTDQNGNTYGVSRDEFPATTKAKLVK